jgi:hypothetical protein
MTTRRTTCRLRFDKTGGGCVALDEKGFIETGPDLSIKCVASAVGEGSIAVPFVHRVLNA